MHAAVVRICDGDQQTATHVDNALHMIHRRRSFHSEAIDHPDLPAHGIPCDEHRGERMVVAKVDPNAPTRRERQMVLIECFDQRRQQLEREHRAGAELRGALKPGFALGITVAGAELLAPLRGDVFGFRACNAMRAAIGRCL